MRWTVTWVPAAQNALADIWNNAPDRADVTAAANRMDANLRRDPYAHSESRSGTARVMLQPPLGVSFDVSDADRLVTVRAVWRTQ
ncbi:MAG TPA: hypothetical protein VJ739_00740 [Gemmataceae bacterium]|nr:hypothetical protein [Gemmataceae bacterium]